MNNQDNSLNFSVAPFAPILTTDKFADLIGVTKSVVDNWVKRGYISTVKIGRRRFINVVGLVSSLNQRYDGIKASSNPIIKADTSSTKPVTKDDIPPTKQSVSSKDSVSSAELSEARKKFKNLPRKTRRAFAKKYGSIDKAIHTMASGKGI